MQTEVKHVQQLLKQGPGKDPECWCRRVCTLSDAGSAFVWLRHPRKQVAVKLRDAFNSLARRAMRLPKTVGGRSRTIRKARFWARNVNNFIQGKMPPTPRLPRKLRDDPKARCIHNKIGRDLGAMKRRLNRIGYPD